MNYYDEIKNYVKKVEIGRAIREANANYELVDSYWNIGKLIVDAQGGKEKSKYGDKLLKEWSEKLTQEYGKGYDYSNLKRFRQFYLTFSNCGAVRHKLSWTNICKILPIKDENKRNYYINLCIKNNLSKRELTNEIKNNSYERLLNKPDKVDIISPTLPNNITDNYKNPIILELADSKVKTECDLEKVIYAQLNTVFKQLGDNLAWVGNQYKITVNNKSYFIDMLLFNLEFNCYVVMELKLRELKKEDKAQVEFYMNLVDNYRKSNINNPTIGIIISKKQDKFVAEYVKSEKLIPLTYEFA